MAVFSVIIPVYNVERYLEQCIRSVREQDFKDIEILLVDDGSTDRSGQMCDEFAQQDCRIKVFHQSNGGLGEARNTGLKQATGEWILFLDSDDFWEENCLKKLYEKIQQYPEQKLYVGKWKKYLQDEERSVPEPVGNFDEGIRHFNTLQERIAYIEERCGWGGCKFVINRKILGETPFLFLKNVRNGEDIYWILKLLERVASICFVDVVVFCYRSQNKGTLSEVSAENALKWLKSMLITLETIEAEKIREKQFVLSWLAEIDSFYLSCASTLKQLHEWKKQAMQHKRFVRYIMPDFSSKKGKLLRASSYFGVIGLWFGCVVNRMVIQSRQDHKL